MDYVKPPLGLRPKEVWLMQRREEIYQAIQRYFDACPPKEIPKEWLQQLIEIEDELESLNV